ncbi:hypothetical protein Pmar_PMAR023042 [Perkinsus marinus ATCC 50983]|uniref:Uncharacterized protein n=1 Tax=Perkinsus marinus (strain ATCC 50983 / TXsc) TaxID=423536 RepID=C5LHZ0_PERM5|nr:hypothetical protein Pmar_PMAR023042 [Perkinsus marinus ATCC 50983]EER03744.1 hypothetical protein Pmar_PMAR023042 [Perkinsus marinus ATCC 50983]|eukprot:XP_002771928.1 hypothetical protein Pmar_PMAR023042 [Perkinsus marinus ATCC 50983]
MGCIGSRSSKALDQDVRPSSSTAPTKEGHAACSSFELVSASTGLPSTPGSESPFKLPPIGIVWRSSVAPRSVCRYHRNDEHPEVRASKAHSRRSTTSKATRQRHGKRSSLDNPGSRYQLKSERVERQLSSAQMMPKLRRGGAGGLL